MRNIILATGLLFCCACKLNVKTPDDRLANSSREDKNGWVYLHLQGSSADIGYQHGFLLATEIDSALQTLQYYLQHTTNKDWSFYRNCASAFLWNKVDTEYQHEIAGIAEGLQAKGKKYDTLDITALNAFIELSQYYVPQLQNREHPGTGDNKAPGNCSAFIATGSYTKDGKIVMGHNNWIDYILGERWNVVADIAPQRGSHIIMDCFPGFIHSGDDFVISSNGILITETTITGFKGFDSTATPEFVRARRAAQYANSIDDVINTMVADNNGGYANDWLIGDIKTNEVAKLELGLKNHRVWRSKDTAIIGSNFPSDPKLIAEETTFKVKDSTNSPNGRKLRFEKLIIDMKGKIDPETGKVMEGDHMDATKNAMAADRCVICGHIDADPVGCPEWSEGPFYPMGAVEGKVTSASMAQHMQFWGRMGHPCGESFVANPFFEKHPEYKWQSKFLRDMPGNPWTLFEAKK